MCALMIGGIDYLSAPEEFNFEKLFRAMRNYSDVIGDLINFHTAETTASEAQKRLAEEACRAIEDPAVTVKQTLAFVFAGLILHKIR